MYSDGSTGFVSCGLVLQPQQLGQLQKHGTQTEHTHLQDVAEVYEEKWLLVLTLFEREASDG